MQVLCQIWIFFINFITLIKCQSDLGQALMNFDSIAIAKADNVGSYRQRCKSSRVCHVNQKVPHKLQLTAFFRNIRLNFAWFMNDNDIFLIFWLIKKYFFTSHQEPDNNNIAARVLKTRLRPWLNQPILTAITIIIL